MATVNLTMLRIALQSAILPEPGYKGETYMLDVRDRQDALNQETWSWSGGETPKHEPKMLEVKLVAVPYYGKARMWLEWEVDL